MSCFNFVILHYSPIQWFSQSMTTVTLKLKFNSYFTLNIFHTVKNIQYGSIPKEVYLRLPFKGVHSTTLCRLLVTPSYSIVQLSYVRPTRVFD